MYCRSCGNSIEAGAKFCPKCGTENAFVPNTHAVNGNTAELTAGSDRIRFKKPIIILAVIALVLIFISSVMDQIASYRLYYYQGMTAEGFVNYAIEYLYVFILDLILPTAIAVLFVVFCGLLGKTSRALTGIPMLCSIAVTVVSLTVMLIRYIQVDNIEIFFRANIISIFELSLSILFIVFYMLAVTGKLRSQTAGRVLTIVFAGIIKVTGLIFMISGIDSYAKSFGTLNMITLFHSAGAVLGFIAGLLTALAMILCVFSTKKPKVTASAPLPEPCYIPIQMFCPKCGVRFPQGKKYCDQCGTELMQVSRQDHQLYT